MSIMCDSMKPTCQDTSDIMTYTSLRPKHIGKQILLLYKQCDFGNVANTKLQ